MRGRVMLLAAAGCVLALVVPGSAGAAAGISSRLAAAKAPTSARTVTLVTGERVLYEAGGPGSRPRVTVEPAARSGLAGVTSTIVIGGDVYVIPATARPYLGRFLDASLFDVTALARAGASARVPVHLAYSGSRAPALPGVTLTATAAGSAAGYVTASSARVFGAALAQQYKTDTERGWPATDALFGGLQRLSSGLAAAPAGAVPAYPMRTLIIRVLDPSGAVVPFAAVTLTSIDDVRKFDGFAIVIHGQARVSVPVGTYAGLVEVDTVDPHTGTGSVAMVPFDGYVVSGNAQTLTLDARTATSRLSVRTPRAADIQGEAWEWDRFDAAGSGGIGASVWARAGFDIYTAPVAVPPAGLGTSHSLAWWSLAGTPAHGLPYTYDLAFPADGVPANQAYVVRATQLETVTARYFSDSPTHQGQFGRFPSLPFQFVVGGQSSILDIPQQRLEYVLALPSLAWSAQLIGDLGAWDLNGSWLEDGPRVAQGGSKSAVDWARGPLVPGVPFATDGFSAGPDGFSAGPVACPVCRARDKLELFLAPVTDTTPGHFGPIAPSPDGTPVARFRLYRGNTLLADQPDGVGGVFPVQAAPAVYRVVYELNRRPGGATQSLTTRTELTFRSGAGQGAATPPGWACDLGPVCTIPSLLQAHVLVPVDLHGAVPVGAIRLGLTLQHIQGATGAPITSAKMEVRVGNGTWQTLPATVAGPGRYQFPLTTTAAQAGAGVDLRVTGTDANGGRIVQTTTRAFVVAS